MHRSIRLLSQQLLKAREQVFESKKVVRKDLFKIVAIGGFTQILLCLTIEEFGLFTPDICFDGRMLISPEFFDFVKNGKYATFDMGMSSAIQSYKVEQGRVVKMTESNGFEK